MVNAADRVPGTASSASSVRARALSFSAPVDLSNVGTLLAANVPLLAVGVVGLVVRTWLPTNYNLVYNALVVPLAVGPATAEPPYLPSRLCSTEVTR